MAIATRNVTIYVSPSSILYPLTFYRLRSFFGQKSVNVTFFYAEK
ncbi:hypothetical protein JMA_07490 [Jeotgalibacillus malaysiensis]|uniref:Uncharacterized protein n=1 Tax=Jeotgalibacillus malaysiensis TaxID=1508404 RepID=A0A0B5AI49_9BACL|nr:hypothetical protein JMA_07490 [Jeotgalibacillus malaysiensis]